jgi:hypothetical protein
MASFSLLQELQTKQQRSSSYVHFSGGCSNKGGSLEVAFKKQCGEGKPLHSLEMYSSHISFLIHLCKNSTCFSFIM